MCSSPFYCALFGNGLLKLEDSRREKRVGVGVVRDGEICVFVIQAEENSSISEKLLSGEQSQVKTT